MRSPTRKLGYILIMVLILAGIIPFALPLKDGKPLLNFSDLKLPEFNTPEWTKTVKHKLENPDQPAPRTVYRWKDDAGTTQYGGEPPKDGRPYEAVTVDPNANLIAGGVQKPQTKAVATPRPEVTQAKDSGLPIPFNPGKIKSVVDDARGVEGMLKERKALQDQAIGASQ